MSFFSFFKSKNEVSQTSSEYSQYFTKELFSEIVDKNSSMMLYFTKNDGWIGANRIFYETFGLSNIKEFRSKYESVRDLFLNESEEIFTEDDKSWLEYIKRYKKDGHNITISSEQGVVSINAKCHTFSKSKNFYILELEDISELHRAKLKTTEAENIKSKFLTNIEHEFRTPMNGILGFMELISKTDLSSEQKEYMGMINRSSRNLMSNIETLLDLSKMQGGKLRIENENFEIASEMENMAYTFSILGKDKEIKVLSFIDPKLPKVLDGDIRKIKQIMNSLIQNAIRYTQKGGRIVVSVKLLKREVSGKCSIGFEVKDNGKGITNEQIVLMTETFDSTNHDHDKVAISLSLSHGLVSLMGSELKIQSEEGYGSSYNFVLDFETSAASSYRIMTRKKVKVLLLDQTKVEEANLLTRYLRSFAIDVVKSNIFDKNIYKGIDALYIIADQEDPSLVINLGTFTKKTPIVFLIGEEEKLVSKFEYIVDDILDKPLMPSTIAKHLEKLYQVLDKKHEVENSLSSPKDKFSALVVEDNIINQRLIEILLQEYGITVSIAENGLEAVDKSVENSYDIIFMDIDMPIKDGIAATKEIKGESYLNKKTPIVALTAMALEGDKEMLLREGLDDYMAKPLTRSKLEDILNKYLKLSV